MVRQHLEEAGHMHAIYEGMVGLHCNREHLLAILQKATAGCDRRYRRILRDVWVLNAGKT